MSVVFRHAYCSACGPTENLSHNNNRRSQFKQFGGSGLPQIVKTQSRKRVRDNANAGLALELYDFTLEEVDPVNRLVNFVDELL